MNMDESAGALLKWVIFALVILGLAWYFTGGPNRPAAFGGPFIKPLAPVGSGETYGDLSKPKGDTSISIVAGSQSESSPSLAPSKIKIEKGSASSAIQPTEEYIYLKNVSSESVNLTGWKIQNAGIVQGGSGILRGSQRAAIIPAGVTVYEPGVNKPLESIILQPSERAVVTTGKISTIGNYTITSSFKTNLCTGYLGNIKYYPIKPDLTNSCPDPENEPGTGSLDDTCFKFIKNLGRCQTPEFKPDPINGGETVDGKSGLPSACRDFMRLHYNYAGCLLFHRADANFTSGKEWRVFLNTLPLWAKDRETIYLYDANGRLVDSLPY